MKVLENEVNKARDVIMPGKRRILTAPWLDYSTWATTMIIFILEMDEMFYVLVKISGLLKCMLGQYVGGNEENV